MKIKYERQRKGKDNSWEDFELPKRKGKLGDELIQRLEDLLEHPEEILYTSTYRYRIKEVLE